MGYNVKEIERNTIAMTGMYVAAISCVIITITGIILGHDLLSVLIRALLVLVLTWPLGCFFGFIGFKIFEESLTSSDKELEESEEENADEAEQDLETDENKLGE